MRNYIRYIVLLVLIIAGGLLIISVVNKFSEPDVSKVDNSNQAEETTTTTGDEPSLDVNTTTDDTQTEDDASTGADSTDSSDSSTVTEEGSSVGTTTSSTDIATDSVVVPNTAADSSIVFTVLGFSMIIGGIGLVKRRVKTVKQLITILDGELTYVSFLFCQK